MSDLSDARHLTLPANGIRIHAVELGEGPLVLLVHGFPESWYSWRHQLPALADAGFRAAAIDVRGYGRSSKPTAVDDYRMMAMVGDGLTADKRLARIDTGTAPGEGSKGGVTYFRRPSPATA